MCKKKLQLKKKKLPLKCFVSLFELKQKVEDKIEKYEIGYIDTYPKKEKGARNFKRCKVVLRLDMKYFCGVMEMLVS